MAVQVAVFKQAAFRLSGLPQQKETVVPLLLLKLLLLLMLFCFTICVKSNGFALAFCLALPRE